MAEQQSPPAGAGYVTTDFPVAGLSRVVRHITGHNAEGKSVFLSTDCGDHHRVMGEKQAIGNIIYSTHETPIELNDDVDIKKAQESEVGVAPPPPPPPFLPSLLITSLERFFRFVSTLHQTNWQPSFVNLLTQKFSPACTSTTAP